MQHSRFLWGNWSISYFSKQCRTSSFIVIIVVILFIVVFIVTVDTKMNRSKILIYSSILHAIKEVHRDSLIFVDLKSSADSDACLFRSISLMKNIKKTLLFKVRKRSIEWTIANKKYIATRIITNYNRSNHILSR